MMYKLMLLVNIRVSVGTIGWAYVLKIQGSNDLKTGRNLNTKLERKPNTAQGKKKKGTYNFRLNLQR